MYRQLETISVLGFLVLLEISLVCACPDDVVKGVFNCLRHVATTDTGLSASRDAAYLKSKCLDGSFDVTISCVQDLRYSCRHDNRRREMIDRTVSVDKMQSAFADTCNNIEVQVKSASCVSKYKDRINICCANVQNQFEREKEFADTEDLKLQLICSVIDAITRCSERPVRLYCSIESADVTVRLSEGLKPPGCLPYDRSSSVLSASLSFVLFTVLVFILITH